MPIRLSGMNSGLDTDSIVQALVSSYSLKKTNLQKSQTKLSWTQDAWKDLNKKVYSFYTGKLSAMRFSSSYSLKTASVSNSSVAKVTASTTAVNGNQKLVVKKLASSGYLTGGELGGTVDGEKVKSSTKLKDISGMGDFADGGKLTVKADANSAEKTIELSADMTVQQFVNKLKESGLSASYDEGNQRFFINSKASGVDGDFTLTSADGKGANALRMLGLSTASESRNNYAAVAGWTDSDVINKAKAAYDSKIASYNDKIDGFLKANDALNQGNKQLELKKKYADAYQNALVYEAFPDNANPDSYSPTAESREKAAKDLDDSIKAMEERKKQLDEIKGSGTELTDEQKAELDELNENITAAKDVYASLTNDTLLITRQYVDELDEEGNPTGVRNLMDNDIDKYIQGISDSISENQSKIDKNIKSIQDLHAEVGSTYDATDPTSNAKIETGFNVDATIADAISANNSNTLAKSFIDSYAAQRDDANDKLAAYDAAQAKLEANQALTPEEEKLLGVGSSAGSSAVRIYGSDSEIELNGATFKSTTNNYSINGLTIQALNVSDEPVTITTDTDVDGIYNMIKDFFKEYNEVMTYMDTKYNASSAKGYEPLSDDEKDAMSDKEVEKWEEKIKESLLRKDNTLFGISNQMKTNMLKSYEINGEKYSLSSFGISTLGYFASSQNERGSYHIAGDADDSATSSQQDKLRAAIASDPDTVIEFFGKLADGVYSDLTKKMSRTNLRSAYTLYNDKQMNTEYSSYTSKISSWEDKISDREDYYYKKFAAMEKAMATLNSQQTSMTNYFG